MATEYLYWLGNGNLLSSVDGIFAYISAITENKYPDVPFVIYYKTGSLTSELWGIVWDETVAPAMGDKIIIENLAIVETAVKPVPEEYIPDTIARKIDMVQADWEQSDPQQPNYIHNRPFGEFGEAMEYVISPQILTFGAGSVTPITPIAAVNMPTTAGTVLYIYWNGTVYEKAISAGFGYSVTGDESDPFASIGWGLGSNTLNVRRANTEQAETVEFAISLTPPPTVKQLDEKYIPDTIARITDIPETGVTSWNDRTDKPFEKLADDGYILEPTILSFNNGYCSNINDVVVKAVDFEPGATIHVKYGDSEFDAIVQESYSAKTKMYYRTLGDSSSALSFTSLSYSEEKKNTLEELTFTSITDYVTSLTGDAEVSLYGAVTTYKTIDKNMLPENILNVTKNAVCYNVQELNENEQMQARKNQGLYHKYQSEKIIAESMSTSTGWSDIDSGIYKDFMSANRINVLFSGLLSSIYDYNITFDVLYSSKGPSNNIQEIYCFGNRDLLPEEALNYGESAIQYVDNKYPDATFVIAVCAYNEILDGIYYVNNESYRMYTKTTIFNPDLIVDRYDTIPDEYLPNTLLKADPPKSTDVDNLLYGDGTWRNTLPYLQEIDTYSISETTEEFELKIGNSEFFIYMENPCIEGESSYIKFNTMATSTESIDLTDIIPTATDETYGNSCWIKGMRIGDMMVLCTICKSNGEITYKLLSNIILSSLYFSGTFTQGTYTVYGR